MASCTRRDSAAEAAVSFVDSALVQPFAPPSQICSGGSHSACRGELRHGTMDKTPLCVAFCLVCMVTALMPGGMDTKTYERLQQVLEANAQVKIRERRGFLYSADTRSQALPLRRKTWYRVDGLQSHITPYYPCLWSLAKEPSVRVVHDGGKVTCGIKELGDGLVSGRSRGCFVFSFGSARIDDFEAFVDN